MEEILRLLEELTAEDGTVPAEAFREKLAALAAGWGEERKALLLREEFWRAGAKQAEFLAYQYRDAAQFDEAGGLTNGAELVEQAKEEYIEFFTRQTVKMSGIRPQEGKSPDGPHSLAGMGYAERLRLLNDDPEMYQRLKGSDVVF